MTLVEWLAPINALGQQVRRLLIRKFLRVSPQGQISSSTTPRIARAMTVLSFSP
jgi:hypothetical protein